LDRQWQAIEEMFRDEPGERIDLVGELSREMPHLAEFADLDRPLAMVVGVPDLMGGQDPDFLFIVPIIERPGTSIETVMEEEEVTYLIEGEYLAFSTGSLIVPAVEIPDLALGLSPGFISASLNLGTVLEAYRPLVEMGLGAMANAPALPDSQAIEAGPHPQQMSPEEVAAMQDLAHLVMASARRFDLAFASDGEELTLHSGFSVQPGSPLDPGPQPEFEHALQLTRLLPPGGNIIQTMALDQTRQFEVFRDFYLVSAEKQIADLPPEQAAAYRTWVESYLDSVDLFANPLAASIRMSAASMSANIVMECADAAVSLERFAALFEGLSALDIGVKMKKMPTGKVAGTEVRSWTIDYDLEKMAGLSPQPANPKPGGTGRLQADQMIAFLRKVTPNLNLAVRGDYLILSADKDPSNLAHMIQLAGQRRGAAHPPTAAAATKAGPACQQVVTGDLMAILSWITEWMEELEDEEYATIEGNPIPFTATSTIEGAAYGLDWTMDMPAVKRFVKAVQELEAMENRHDDAGDDEDDGDENDDEEAKDSD
ncbi:MAG: hypothetical protein ABFS42_11110, partial [Candidatus Krumholzibacteriota bacterium]